MNIFAMFKQPNGRLELVTPPLDSGLILPGVTRRSVLELARDLNEFDVNERKLTMKEILKGKFKIFCPVPSAKRELKSMKNICVQYHNQGPRTCVWPGIH